ncbi:MAG: hypothetical protein IBX64_00795 [Actinobacteria bacterium]|nr:hypothetical protein [Actinomycetota bacterium]
MFGGKGIIELLYIAALIISTIWVYIDAPRFSINRYLAALVTLLIVYPLGFFLYLLVSRLQKHVHSEPVKVKSFFLKGMLL